VRDESGNPIFGLVGQAGELQATRSISTQAVLACWADPCEGRLYEVVPIPTWPNEASNESAFFGPLELA